MDALEALRLVLDQVDYENGACQVNEPVGAVLPRDVLALARGVAQAKPIPAAKGCYLCDEGIIHMDVDCGRRNRAR